MKCTYWSDPGFWPGIAETHRIEPRCRTRLGRDLLSSWLRRTAALACWLIASDILLLPGHDLGYLSKEKSLVFSLARVGSIFSYGSLGTNISVGVGIDRSELVETFLHLEIVLPSYN